MSSFSTGVSKTVMRQVLAGLLARQKAGEKSFADKICRRVEVDSTMGFTFIEPSVITVPPEGLDAGIPEGTSPKKRGGKLERLDFSLRLFKDLAEIPFVAQVDGAAVGYNTVKSRMSFVKSIVDMKLDLHFSRMISNENDEGGTVAYNKSFDPTDAGNGGALWNDAASRPTYDMKLMHREIGMVDTAIVGSKVVTELSTNKHFLANAGYQINGGDISNDMVCALIAKTLGIEKDRVFIFDAYYRQGTGENENFQLQYLFDKGFWMGLGRDLILMDLISSSKNPNPNPINDTDRTAETHTVGMSRRAEVKRPHAELGIYSEAVA